MEGRKSWLQRVNRNEAQQRNRGKVWGAREARKGPEGGNSRWGRDQEIAKKTGGCKRHPAPTICHGAATVTGEGRGTSWDSQGKAPQPGAQRLITGGLSGHIKQMMIITRLLLPRWGEGDSSPFRTRPDHRRQSIFY